MRKNPAQFYRSAYIYLFHIFVGVQIGTVLANLLGGVILEYMPTGWEAVFYIFGTVSVIWFLFWIVLCYNDPSSHPFITEREKMFLKESIGQTERNKVDSWKAVVLHVYLC